MYYLIVPYRNATGFKLEKFGHQADCKRWIEKLLTEGYSPSELTVIYGGLVDIKLNQVIKVDFELSFE